MSHAQFLPSWGAIPLGDGTARFRLWAPAQDRLGLRTRKGDLAMSRLADGWFELVTDQVRIGEAYGFVLADGAVVPDPASRGQATDVHGLSRLLDRSSYRWRHEDWPGRPWEEAVLYELHIGSFTPAGSFAAAAERLPHLADLGVTAVELMPVAEFSGARGWGYDGVLPYAPHHAYGQPDDLKALIDAAHGHGLMVLLDVVYNHFGPDGNYLHLYAPDFFDCERQTPWGAAIAYDKRPVRDFIRDNALYWLEEYRFDGLRLDAIDHIDDPSAETILDEIARTVRERLGPRQVHLTTEDSRNVVHLHRRDGAGRPLLYTAEWNDDFHHAAHVVATGESEGYYRDFAPEHWSKLARALAEGYVYQGEVSVHWGGQPRGEPCVELPPVAFINFLQNHDQVGNRAFGERLLDLSDRRMVEILTVILLLSPEIPLLFMGEEWGETRPFCYFTDFAGPLAEAVREGRRSEFRAWSAFSAAESRAQIPDPNALATFTSSRPDWSRLEVEDGQIWLRFYRHLIELRRREIVPRLFGMAGGAGKVRRAADGLISLSWRLADAARLHLDANFAGEAQQIEAPAGGRLLFAWPGGAAANAGEDGGLQDRSVLVMIADPGGEAGPEP